jgi:hypothetical protein
MEMEKEMGKETETDSGWARRLAKRQEQEAGAGEDRRQKAEGRRQRTKRARAGRQSGNSLLSSILLEVEPFVSLQFGCVSIKSR